MGRSNQAVIRLRMSLWGLLVPEKYGGIFPAIDKSVQLGLGPQN